jgi:hypothetical protein
MKKFILIGFILSIIAGCKKDFLDTRPQAAISSSIIWSSDAYATMAVNGIYGNFLGERYFGDYTWRYSLWGPDALDYGGGTMEQGRMNAGTRDIWRKYAYMYGLIRLCNDAIANITDNPKLTPEVAQRLIGESKFIRGFCYFNLWASFGGLILLDKPTPIQETYTLTRSTSEETQQFLIKDFTDAIAALPVDYSASPSNTGRATKGAAQAMLGKTYLYAQNWAKAAEELGKLMKSPYSYGLPPDYASVFLPENERNNEIIWDMECIDYPGLGSEQDFRYGGRSLPVSGWSQTVASWAVVNSYTNQDGSAIDISDMPKRENYANEHDYGLVLIPWYQQKYKNADKRLHDNIIMPGDTILGNGNLQYMMKWPFGDHANDNPYPAYQLDNSDKASFAWRKFVMDNAHAHVNREDAPLNLIFIRYADVLLQWAEAKNEASGPSSDIFDAINMVRDRGHVPHISGLSKDDLRNAIRMERMRELPGEGQLFFDVRRWKLAATTDPIFGLNRVENDFTMRPYFTSVFPEKYYLFPIPQDELNFNKNLTQNPGWQ